MYFRCRSSFIPSALITVAAAALLVASAVAGEPEKTLGELRVCADPNNMPYSNAEGEGFENRIAEIIAADLGKKVSYTWWAQRRGFIRNTLKAGKCDVVIGVPNLDMLATTRSYYRSTYVFVTRKDRDLDFSSMNAPELRELKIGVHLIGDDGANTPPAHALAKQGIIDNVAGYTIYGDYREDSPPSRLIKDVVRGKIDIAAAWGPLAGYYAKKSSVPLRVVPITDTAEYLPLVFQYSIAMGVRKYDRALKDKLDEALLRKHDAIEHVLDTYGVPRL